MNAEKNECRKEQVITDGWEFSLKGRTEGFYPIDIPHDWAISAPFDKDMSEGGARGFRSNLPVGWYRKKLVLGKKQEGRRYLLDFGGIYEDSTVWINGKEAGGRKFGYSSFAMDVTELLAEGDNLIEVRADCSKHPFDRWYGGAGIYRTVKLIEVNELHFDPLKVMIHTEIEGEAACVTIDTGIKGRVVRAVLKEENGFESVSAEGNDGRAELRVEKARLWSAEEPNLYRLTLSLIDGERTVDQIRLRVGLREITMVSGEGMFVNGQRVILKGVCLHQDTGCMGVAAHKEIYRQRLSALKEAGCNAIRAAHHTYCAEFLDLCDEMGFYVYEECFDKWHGGHYGMLFETQWQKDVEAMVMRDRNRPCIFIWGVGNEVENQAQPSMLATLKLLTEYVRELDSTRPVSYAMNPHFKRESKVDVSKVKDIQKFVDEVSDTEIYDVAERVECIAKIAEYVDVISCNYQEQWYPHIHERLPDKLILGTEVYQYFMGAPDQMQNFSVHNPSLIPQEKKYVIGSFIWTGIDYLGESMGYPSKGWGGSLIRTNGNRRPSYYILQSYWSKKPMVRFSVMDYSLEDEMVKEHWDIPMLAEHWHFPQFRRAVIPYVIASNCEEVRLYLNGKQFMIPRPSECADRLITGFLPYQAGTVQVIGCNGGEEVCRQSVVTPGHAVGLSFLGDAWTFERPFRLPAQKGYQLQLAVQAVDEEENPCFRESVRVRFRVEGPAEILAVDSGDLTGDEPYQSASVHLFRGQASVMLGLTGECGRVCLYADAEGMRQACHELWIEEASDGD